MKKLTGLLFIIAAILIGIQAGIKGAGYKELQKSAGKTMGTVERVTMDKEYSGTGRSHIVNRAIINYEVAGKSYTSAIVLAHSAMQKGDTMLIYYDKNDPNKILNTPESLKSVYILCSIFLVAGLAVVVWAPND